MRKVVAIAAAPGFLAGTYIFIASFFGLTMDKLGARAVLLHLGIFGLFLPLVIGERRSKGVDPFGGRPRWVVRSIHRLHLRKRLSIPERLGTTPICLRLDVFLLHTYDELVVSSERRNTVDIGDARLMW